MGLAQLHQLRGRVGRSNRRASAYLTFRRGRELSEIAEKRLSAIREFAEFNSGFRIAMRDLEIRGAGSLLGAEQSGHMILLEHNSTGDGLVTACQFLAAVRRSGKPVEEAIKVMTKFPQTLINVRVKDKHALEGSAPIWDAVHAAEAEMGDTGRVLVRTSGTEPLVRVMVEAETQESADAHAKAIAEVVERELA